MTMEEARQIVEKANPAWRAIACTPFRDQYIFSLAGKGYKPYWRTPRVWAFPVGSLTMVPVNKVTGEIDDHFDLIEGISEEDSEEFDSCEMIYFEDLTPPKI